MAKRYSAQDIQVLQGLEAIRLRPGIYIGDVGPQGLHHLLHEAVDNAVDEFLDGHVDEIVVTLLPDGAVVQDNGRGIPVEHHEQADCSTLEAVFTRMHAGGKFKRGAYTTAIAGLNGIGTKAITALSTLTIATTVRDGKAWQQQYSQGKPTTKVQRIKSDLTAGVRIEFYPDPEIFGQWKWQPRKVATWLQDTAWLCPGLTIVLTSGDKTVRYHSPDGLAGLLAHETPDATIQGDVVEVHVAGVVDAAFCWTDLEGEHWRSWVNVVNTPGHGVHVKGATRAIQDFLQELSNQKIRGEDLRDGLVGAIHVRTMEPKFQGQTKQRLDNPEVETQVYEIVLEHLRDHRTELQDQCLAIVARAKRIQDARQKFRAEQSAIKNVKVKRGARGLLPDKLVEAPDCSPDERELYIVEGDSAGGTVKKARIRKKRGRGDHEYHYQEVFQLRGKVANAARKGEVEDLLKNQEVKDLITAIGAGIGDSFDLTKCRYRHVYLLADADPDGKHIVALLLGLFARYFPALISAGIIRVVLNPLFMGVTTDRRVYGDTVEEVRDKLGGKQNIRITRFKGLGESNAADLQAYALHPRTRRVMQVLWDERHDAVLVQRYMGLDVQARREILGIVD